MGLWEAVTVKYQEAKSTCQLQKNKAEIGMTRRKWIKTSQGRPDPNGTRTKEYNGDNSKSYYVIPPKKIVVHADYRPSFGDEVSFKNVIYFSRKF